jgi:uncharacterized protein (TIRG00374 family)
MSVPAELEQAPTSRGVKQALVGGLGLVLGGVFLWLAVRNVAWADVVTALRQADRRWLAIAVTVYLVSIGVRCVRWGVLLRATGQVRWRHAAEALLTGFAANYVLPGRVGELFRADYARRIFRMSTFKSLGTIVVERVCDGIVLVCALWLGLAWFSATRLTDGETSSIVATAAAASVLFGAAAAFVLVARRFEPRRFGVPERLAVHVDKLLDGVTSVLRGNAATVVLCTLGVWALEFVALGSIVHGFGIELAPSECLLLLGFSSLSTLVPTAPGYVGTYQLVFVRAFQLFGYPQTIAIAAATAFQVFCFGAVTVLGGLVLLSRSGVTIWRARYTAPPPLDNAV